MQKNNMQISANWTINDINSDKNKMKMKMKMRIIKQCRQPIKLSCWLKQTIKNDDLEIDAVYFVGVASKLFMQNSIQIEEIDKIEKIEIDIERSQEISNFGDFSSFIKVKSYKQEKIQRIH